jgi:hypothetical protein
MNIFAGELILLTLKDGMILEGLEFENMDLDSLASDMEAPDGFDDREYNVCQICPRRYSERD